MATSTNDIRTASGRKSGRGARAGLRLSETLPPEEWGYVEQLDLNGAHAPRRRRRPR